MGSACPVHPALLPGATLGMGGRGAVCCCRKRELCSPSTEMRQVQAPGPATRTQEVSSRLRTLSEGISCRKRVLSPLPSPTPGRSAGGGGQLDSAGGGGDRMWG